MYNPYTLEGKTILITGASSGIGKCSAIECSKMGAKLVITGRDEERLNETFERLEGKGYIQLVADLIDEEAIHLLVESISTLDGVFFCTGVTDTTLIKFLNKEKIDRVFDINFVSPVLLTKALVQKKKINKMASLVYMSSMGAEAVAPGLGIYAASKNAINSMAKTVALELVNRLIRVNTIMPSMVKTELLETLTSFSKEDLAKDEAKYPLGYGEPEDVAYAAIYLLSDASRWITGSFIKMDGGSTLA